MTTTSVSPPETMQYSTKPLYLHPHSQPRRQPAHRSVSLRHSSRSDVPTSASQTAAPSSAMDSQKTELSSGGSRGSGASRSSPSSLKPLIGKDDSGESSNADKWFDKSNNHASCNNSTSYMANSPPFFFQNSSSEETPLHANNTQSHNFAGYPQNELALRSNLLHLDTDGSSAEDFRGVIDDLTIENKKLKRKLKTYEKFQDPHLKDQKLFEVRVHGLPADKKRELEDMLRKFALGLNGDPVSETIVPRFPGMSAGLAPHKSGSSLTSTNNADSTYASASGQASSGQGSSNQAASDARKRGESGTKYHQNIHSYLHDIPEGHQHPQNPAAMTEKQKQKLVVRRLEQIFAGKGAGSGPHSQPLQQQEVSQLAAKADRSAMEHTGQKAPAEGIREAYIMRTESEEQNGNSPAHRKHDATQHLDASNKVGEQDFAGKITDQRPTRPLDLDPHRAQVPADNMQYIRHLGFSPPGAEALEPPQDGHGWIYLNLLVNMAQLHTVNVTSDFVKKSLQEYSSKFELSVDGRKIRWKGGKSVSKTSSDGADTPSMVGGGSSHHVSYERGSPRKRMRLAQQGGSSSGSNTKSKSIAQPQSDSRLSYTPLFHHRSSSGSDSESEEEYEDEDTNESAMPLQHGTSSGITGSGMRSVATKQRNRKRDTGPIIFYNNARFCTDLSGDSKTEEAMLYNAYLYHNVSTQPVGTVENKPSAIIPSETRGPLDQANELPEAMDLSDNPIPFDMEVSFPEQSPLSDQAGKDRKTYELKVSGLGGVCAADNFAINVESRHAALDNVQAPETVRYEVPQSYPQRITQLLKSNAAQRKSRSAFHKQILSTIHQILPPTELPDASCFMPINGDTSIDDEDESDSEDVMSICPDTIDCNAPSAAPQPINMTYIDSDSEDEVGDDEDEWDDDDGDESEDGSLDLLATARELDPEAVRRRELEYDSNMAERLAEEIPAGSSAATAGGGSGFNSPASNVGDDTNDELKTRRREMSKQRAASIASKQSSLKRARTSDSMIPNGKGEAGSE